MKLFITADDFGYCPQRNLGIIDCFKAGGITDASLLVNTKYAEDAARLGLEHGLTMGLHFNISEGKPLADTTKIPSLINNSGCFHGKDVTMLLAENARLQIEDIKLELIAQIERFKTLTGAYPRRIDGHQHVHIFPTICDAFAQVLDKYDIRLTRIPNDRSLTKADWMSSQLKCFLEGVATHSIQALSLFKKHRIRSSDQFIGSSLMNYGSTANLTLEHVDTALRTIPPTTADVELMVHPGYPNAVEDGGCGTGPDDFSKDLCRQWELEFLISAQLKAYFINKRLNIQSWEA